MKMPEVVRSQVSARPRAVATCPRCLKRDAEILPTPLTRCARCSAESEAGHRVSHVAVHDLEVCWYLCGACNLAFSGTQDEYDAERRRQIRVDADRSHGREAAQAVLGVLRPPAELEQSA